MIDSWLRLQIEVPAEAVETISYLLSELGSQGVVTLEEELDTFITPDPNRIVTGPQTLKAYFPPGSSPEQLKNQLEEKLQELTSIFPAWRIGEADMSSVRQEDWADGWKQNFQPFHVGSLLVRPSWTADDPTHQGPVMELDPGMAFGTGTHATTRLCLTALNEAIAAAPTECSALDVGTGSGILAIAAAKLGVKQILACDIEPDSCRIAAENAAANNVDSQIRITDQPLEELEGKYQIVLANILAEENIRLAHELVGHLATPGCLILSGILQEKEQMVREGFAPFNLRGPVVTCQDEWIALSYHKDR